MVEEQKRANESLLMRSQIDRKLGQQFRNILKKTGKRLLSNDAGSISEIRQFRACNGKEQLIYLRLRLWDIVTFLDSKPFQPSDNTRSFLFVCFGNIMRSPMCEALMKRASLPGARFAVTSAGLNATPGRVAHPWAITAAEEFGVSLKNHKARLLTAEMVAHADAIFTMDYQNHAQLIARYPETAGKVSLLGTYSSGSARSLQIRDPYYGGEQTTRECYKILEACIQNLVRACSYKRP
jgi:protein-tyrosine phosphatase